MKLLLVLLVAANVAFFAYSRYASQASGEGYLLTQQLNPEAIRVLTPEQVASLGGAKRDASKLRPCVEWGVFSDAEVARAQSALDPLALGAALSQRRLEDKAAYWVFIPSQGSRQAANQKVAELKKLGVEDYFVLQDDPKYRFAISLGVFKTEEAARARLEQLRARGVRTAQFAARDLSTQKISFLIRNVSEALSAKLDEIRRSFPGTEVRECSAENKTG